MAAEFDPEMARLVIDGELVVTTTALLDGAVNACLRENPRSVVLDLGKVRFMDSAGITALLTCRSRASSQGATLTVTSANLRLRRLMRPEVRALLGMDAEPAPVRRPSSNGRSRMLTCLPCGSVTAHVRGPTTLGRDGAVLVQWWSCTVCDEGNTVVS